MKQSIGQKLKQARESQHLTLEKITIATRIRVVYLQALEADDHSAMPSPVQARGFLHNYAEYLGLDIGQLLNGLQITQTSADEIIGPADVMPEPLTQDTAHLSTSEPASPPQTESTPEPAPEKPKRRGRKKVEPASVENKLDFTAEPASPNGLIPEAELVVEVVPESQPEATLPPNTTDSLWQTWLNRLGSIIHARKRPPASNDIIPETESVVEELPQQLQSQEIFHEIGATLLKRREFLSLNLEEVERNTHVKAHYLQALEMGAMGNLPSTVQTRGMLSNYATFLDLDVDALLLRYADALQARHREKNPLKPVRKPGQAIVASLPPMRSFIAGDLIFGVGAAVMLIGFSVWGINRVLTIQSQREDIQPTAPSISDILLATPNTLLAPTTTLLVVESFAEVTQAIIIPTQNLKVNVQLNLVAVERTFMRVIVDGEEVFSGRTVPGTAYLFEGEEQVEVLAGSGAAIRAVYNGRDLGLLGGLGQVVSVIYLEEEIITPTALPTVTPTRTLPATSTLPPTLTPVPSSTPAP